MTNPPPNWQYPQASNWQYPQAQPSGLGLGASGVLPHSMKWAIGLMWAGVGMSIIYNVVSVVMSNSLLSMQTSNTAVNHGAVVGGAVVGAIFQTGLWLWMIWKVRAGRSWARVLSTVFFGIMCLVFVLGVAFAPAASKILIAVYFIVALAALIMLYQRESSAFFSAAQLAPGIEFASRFGQRGYGPPGYESPGYGPPGYGPPGYGPPGYGPPGYGPPGYGPAGYGPPGYDNAGYQQPQLGEVPQQFPQPPQQGGQQPPPPQ